jgi:hypothetical protein
VNFQAAVIIDESQLAKFIHEGAYARPRGADNLGECFLADFCYDRFRFPFLAKVSHQEEHPRQTLFARIEELVDQIFLDASVPSQQLRYESLGKLRFVAEHAHDRHFVEPRDDAFCHRYDRPQAEWLACQASLAKEIPHSVERDDRFLA